MAASSACSAVPGAANSTRSRSKSARSVSDCELTETYSPAAIDIAPATKPAMPATRTLPRLDSAAATPKIKLAVETIPSLAPRTAARSHPVRCVKWCSTFLIVCVSRSKQASQAVNVGCLPATAQHRGAVSQQGIQRLARCRQCVARRTHTRRRDADPCKLDEATEHRVAGSNFPHEPFVRTRKAPLATMHRVEGLDVRIPPRE